MTQIASLPVLSVQIAIPGSGNSWSTNLSSWTWLDITTDTKDLRTTYGKQHELDQHESSTVQFTLDNRLGQYTPWVTIAKTYNLAGGGTTNAFAPRTLAVPMNPVRITATWSGTTYSTFYGYVDSWELQTPDEVNSECLVSCSDVLKVMSNQKLSNPTLYPSAVQNSDVIGTGNWQFVRLGDTYYKSGIAVAAKSSGWGNSDAAVVGKVKTQVQGPHLYDVSTAFDLSAGTSTTASGSVVWPDLNPSNNSSFDYYLEAWFQAASVGDILIANYRSNISRATGIKVDQNGKAMLVERDLGSSTTTDTILGQFNLGPDLTDGNWHLVGLQMRSSVLTVFVDGQYIGIQTGATDRLRIPSIGSWIGGTTTTPVAGFSTTATVADVLLVCDNGSGSSIGDQEAFVHDRYRIGNLLGPGPYSTQMNSISGTGTTVTAYATGFAPGQTITVSGCRPTSQGYNGTFVVDTTPTGDSLTWSDNGTGTPTHIGIISTPKTTGYRVLEALQVAGLIPASAYYINTNYLGSPPMNTLSLSSLPYTGIPLNLDVGTALINAPSQPTFSRSGGEVALQAADTELGAFYQQRDGTIRFRDRYTAARSLASGVTATISDQSGTVARFQSDVDVVQDDLDLWTNAQISDSNVTTWVLPGNATQVNTFGQRTIIRATDAITTDNGITAKQVGATLLYRHQQPSIRVAKVTLGSESGSTTLAAALALDLYNAVLFKRQDSSAQIFSGNFIVENIQVEFLADPGSWHATLVLSPFEIYGAPYLVIGTTTVDSSSPAKWSAPFGG